MDKLDRVKSYDVVTQHVDEWLMRIKQGRGLPLSEYFVITEGVRLGLSLVEAVHRLADAQEEANRLKRREMGLPEPR